MIDTVVSLTAANSTHRGSMNVGRPAVNVRFVKEMLTTGADSLPYTLKKVPRAGSVMDEGGDPVVASLSTGTG